MYPLGSPLDAAGQPLDPAAAALSRIEKHLSSIEKQTADLIALKDFLNVQNEKLEAHAS